jgi:hypothetical protein
VDLEIDFSGSILTSGILSREGKFVLGKLSVSANKAAISGEISSFITYILSLE